MGRVYFEAADFSCCFHDRSEFMTGPVFELDHTVQCLSNTTASPSLVQLIDRQQGCPDPPAAQTHRQTHRIQI